MSRSRTAGLPESGSRYGRAVHIGEVVAHIVAQQKPCIAPDIATPVSTSASAAASDPGPVA